MLCLTNVLVTRTAARTDEAVTGLVGALLGAAGETTARALAWFLANLLDHPGQLEVLRVRPGLMAGAWAESPRRDPPLHVVLRRAAEPVGAIPAGPPSPASSVPPAVTRNASPTPTATTPSAPAPARSPTAPGAPPPPKPSSPVSRPNAVCEHSCRVARPPPRRGGPDGA
ncbi:hypothetical protein [Streptomyces sp. NPDC101455]|uniref:hypothetical protein n=1 Tax=Streptomyces sp. NPDC101455 TaxID=3366142 RepID=UPI003820E825